MASTLRLLMALLLLLGMYRPSNNTVFVPSLICHMTKRPSDEKKLVLDICGFDANAFSWRKAKTNYMSFLNMSLLRKETRLATRYVNFL